MAQVTAKMVADLRSVTGLGMMDCKKALVEAKGDSNKALEILRIKSGVKANKLATRTAAEGVVFICINENKGSIVEINCETDFVSKDDNFKQFVKEVANLINIKSPKSLEQLNELILPNGKSLEEYRMDVIAKLGENICIRRFKYFDSAYKLASYLHGNKIGVLVEYEGDFEVAKDISIHIAASRPLGISSSQIDPKLIAQERHIYIEQAKDSGKPIEIINKMVEGKVKKFLAQISLLGQNFIKNPDITVEQFLKEHDTKILSFVVFEVSEGIDKKVVDYAAEVAAVAATNKI